MPDASVEKDQTNAKGTTAGWKKKTGLNINLYSGVTYWIVVQLDDTSTITTTDRESSLTGERDCSDISEQTLQDPWDTTSATDNEMYSIYALYEAAPPPPPSYTSVNIGDEWKTISGSAVIKVNVGDTWKPVTAMKVNVGDAWKAVTIS